MRSKLRKGIGINTLLALFVGFLMLSLLGALITNSPVAKAMKGGSEKLLNQTDYVVSVSNDDQLSDLAMFVYQRASNQGCKKSGDPPGGSVFEQNNNNINEWKNGHTDQKGYPGISKSYLGRYPECHGRKGDAVKRAGDGSITAKTGEDMEGVYSKEMFEVEKKIVLVAGNEGKAVGKAYTPVEKGRGDTWLEKNFLVASKSSFEASASCKSKKKFSGTRQQFALYFSGSVPNNRAGVWMSDKDKGSGGGIGNNRPYCAKKLKGKINSKPNVQPFMAGDNNGNRDKLASVVLCPGDKGYIQMNKGKKPTDDGEAGESPEGKAPNKFGFIQITELGDNCAKNREVSIKKFTVTYQSGGSSGTVEPVANIHNSFNIKKTVDVTFYDNNGDQLPASPTDVEVPAGKSKLVQTTRKQLPFEKRHCRMDVEVTYDGGSNRVEGVTPAGFTPSGPSKCEGVVKKYDARIANIEKEAVFGYWGLGEKKLRVHGTVVNSGTADAKFNFRMKYGEGKQRGARGSNKKIQSGERHRFTVTKTANKIDGCKVEVHAVSPRGENYVKDKREVSLSGLGLKDNC